MIFWYVNVALKVRWLSDEEFGWGLLSTGDTVHCSCSSDEEKDQESLDLREYCHRFWQKTNQQPWNLNPEPPSELGPQSSSLRVFPLEFSAWCSVPGTQHLALSTRHLELNTWHSSLNIRHSTLGIWHSSLGIRTSASSIHTLVVRSDADKTTWNKWSGISWLWR